jgi:hypothetical protein
MPVVALRIHQHRLAQPPPDPPKEAAEHIKSLLAPGRLQSAGDFVSAQVTAA